MISPCTVRWSPAFTASMTDLSSSARRKRDTRTVLVRSVRSKHSTAAPLLGMVRLVTATTSPSTTTLPDSSVRVFMGTGLVLIGLPMSGEPAGFEGLEDARVSVAAAPAFTRG